MNNGIIPIGMQAKIIGNGIMNNGKKYAAITERGGMLAYPAQTDHGTLIALYMQYNEKTGGPIFSHFMMVDSLQAFVEWVNEHHLNIPELLFSRLGAYNPDDESHQALVIEMKDSYKAHHF